MGTKYPEIFDALAAEFDQSDVKTRRGSGGRDLSYITAPTAANRLDEVLGPEGWEFSLSPWGNDLIGTLTITLPDGTKVSKSNVGGRAEMQAGDDDAKSAASDAFKRCAGLFGVGRYLYGDGQVRFGGGGSAPASYEAAPTPSRPAQATRRQPTQPQRPQGGQRQYDDDRAPTSGKSLFAWLKKQEERHQKALLKPLNEWAANLGYPSKLIDFDADQTAEAVDQVHRMIGGGREPGPDDDREY